MISTQDPTIIWATICAAGMIISYFFGYSKRASETPTNKRRRRWPMAD